MQSKREDIKPLLSTFPQTLLYSILDGKVIPHKNAKDLLPFSKENTDSMCRNPYQVRVED